MKSGFSTNAFVKKSLTFAINSVADIGFDGIEIVLDVPHAFLPITKSHIENIKKNIKQNKLKITNLNANTVVGWYKNKQNIEKFEPSLSNVNEKMRKWRIKNIKQSIDLGKELGAPSICITSGLRKNSTKKESLIRFRDSLDNILPYAEKKGILVGIEYEPGLLIEKFEDVEPFLSEEYKNLGVNFDICHAAVLGENIPKVIKKLGSKLFHTHISDCKNKIHYHLIPGKGEINFKTMYKALMEINYNGYLTAELYPYSANPERAAKETIMYFKNLMN